MTDEKPNHEPPKSVLQQLGEASGGAPNVMLPDSDSVEGVSPAVEPASVDATVLPKGKGNYQVLGEIARGGMGIVMKGRDTDLGRDVAMKVLDEKLSRRPEILRRFVEEAQIGGQLQHPGVVPVYELGLMGDDRPFFTMKLVKGRTLSALLSQRKSLDEDRPRFLRIFEQVCQTVAYAHSKGVIHRDLKPANVMVGAFGEVQVVDWGLAKVLGQGGTTDAERTAEQSALTVIETVRSGSSSTGSDSIAGSVMGTPAYMSPEQASGAIAKVDERSDVFSLGAVLCEILTGKPPYVSPQGGGGHAVLKLASEASLDNAEEGIRRSDADDELKKLCLECMKPARDVRPRNAEEVAQRVHDHLASVEQRARDAELASAAARVRIRLTAALAAVVTLATVGGAWGWITMEGARARRIDDARTAFETARDEVEDLQRAGESARALEVAEGAFSVVAAVDVDEALRARATALVDEARDELDRADRQRELDARNAALVTRLDEIRLRNELSLEEVPLAYDMAFHDYGIDMTADDLGPALDAMLESGIEAEFALALDDWARWVVRFSEDDAEARHVSESLLFVARDLDPHPVRREMRDAILARDREALIELARSDELEQMGAGAVWVLCLALGDLNVEKASRAALARAVELHPDDFKLNMLFSETAYADGEIGLALEHTAAARALRPDVVGVHTDAAGRLADLGRYAGAARADRRALAMAPGDAIVFFRLQGSLYAIGDYDGAVELADDPDAPEPRAPMAWSMSRMNRYLAGRLPATELAAMAEEAPSTWDEGFLAQALAYHHDPARRDADAALRLCERALSRGRMTPLHWLAFAIVHGQRGDWDAMRAAAERADAAARRENRFIQTLPLALLARANASLGDAETARELLETAERNYEYVTYEHPEDWRERCFLARMMAEARAALGR